MKKQDVLAFAFYLEDNIFSLHKQLWQGIYTHGPYEHFFVHDPKKRYISKATVRDRIVHQAIVQIIEPIFERQFIFDSYSSRIDKGTHAAVNRLDTFLRQATSNYRHTVYALKCDIRRFFDSIDHRMLIDVIGHSIHDERLMKLIREVIGSYTGSEDKSCGLPLGNITSQLFANIYLNRFDHFVKERLHARWYIRFCDDFIILQQDQQVLLRLLEQVQGFLLKECRLELHPKKVTIRKFSYGIDFVGTVLRPYYRVLRTKTKRRMFRAIRKRMQEHELDEEFRQSLQSYLGILRHGRNYTIQKNLLEEVERKLKLF